LVGLEIGKALLLVRAGTLECLFDVGYYLNSLVSLSDLANDDTLVVLLLFLDVGLAVVQDLLDKLHRFVRVFLEGNIEVIFFIYDAVTDWPAEFL
jgi:hypothetical protein